MYRFGLYLSVALAVIFSASFVNADGVCTGYPKMYNGLPCASTTRYWDGNKGACGCGTSDTNPFSWQWNKPTAAASPPIYGSGTWCGSGCGKCFKLTPTAVGASPLGTGSPSLSSVVIKVTNLCPPGGNEAWCSYDVNSYGYDAHFDLMDYNMNGLISSMGWDNPEVTYEEVSCAANGYTDWDCECASASDSGASATSSASTSATAAPVAATEAPVATTKVAPVAATTAPVAATQAGSSTNSGNIKLQVNGGSSVWWVGVSLVTPAASTISYIEVADSGSNSAWIRLAYQGDQYWNLYSANPSKAFTLPLSLRFTSTNGNVVTANNIITSFQAATVDTGVAV